MRIWPSLLLSACLLAQTAGAATPNTDRMKACAARWNELKRSGQARGQTYQQFCRAFLTPQPGASAPRSDARSPTAAHPPAGATARCKDGAFTVTPKGKPGACSGHGGVAAWLG